MCINPTLSLSMSPTTQLRLAPSDDHHLSSITIPNRYIPTYMTCIKHSEYFTFLHTWHVLNIRILHIPTYMTCIKHSECFTFLHTRHVLTFRMLHIPTYMSCVKHSVLEETKSHLRFLYRDNVEDEQHNSNKDWNPGEHIAYVNQDRVQKHFNGGTPIFRRLTT